MRTFSKWRKTLLIIFTIFICIRIGYIMWGKVETEISRSTDIDLKDAKEVPCENVTQRFLLKERQLNTVEFILSEISDDKEGVIFVYIYANDEMLYRTSISMSNINNLQWKEVYINLTGKRNKEYEIVFDARNCKQIPNIFLINGQVALKYNYLKEPTLSDKLINVTICCIWLLVIAVFLFYFEKIYKSAKKEWEKLLCRTNENVIVIIIELFLSLIIFRFSGIEFQFSTKVIVCSISLFAVKNQAKKREYIKHLTDKTWKKVSLYFLYFYSGFALTGQRLLIYPLDLKITINSLLVFIITVIWFIPIINSLIYLYRYLSKKIVSEKCKKWKTVKFGFVCLIFLLLPAVFSLYANNPGITSYDTLICMVENAHHLRGMSNWFPAFYCMILRLILTLWDSTYAVILVQYFFWGYVMLEGLLYLRKKGICDGFILIAAFVLGINAANFTHLNTIWKDVPYTLSLLWAVIILGKLSLDFELYKGKFFIYVELFISLIGIYFYRKNGMVSFVVIGIFILIYLWNNKKMLFTLIITVTTIFMIQVPLYQYFEIEGTGRTGMYMGLGQDILGVYYTGGQISEETFQMVSRMTGYDNAEYDYTPTWTRQYDGLGVSPIKFIKNYLDTFIKNPIVMLRAVIAREDALWNIYSGEGAVLGCVNYTGTAENLDGWENYYPKRKYNCFYDLMGQFTGWSAYNQCIGALEWRSGIFTLLGITAILVMIWDKGSKKYLLIISPIIGQIFSLLLSTGWSEFRYFWPLNLMNMFVLLFMPVILSENNNGVESDEGCHTSGC